MRKKQWLKMREFNKKIKIWNFIKTPNSKKSARQDMSFKEKYINLI